MLNNLLEVSTKTVDTVQLISILAIALLLIVVLVIALTNKGHKTRAIVHAAVCIAASFALSFIKVTPVTFGGSITLASFVPILIYAYCYGLMKGLLAGLIFGVLNFIQSPYILVPITFVLDYLLAFASIGLMGLAKKFSASPAKNVILGTLLVYAARFTMHLLSGIVYFNNGGIFTSLPANNAFVYSLLYQITYIIPDMILVLVAFFALIKTNNFNTLLKQLDPAAE